jgi:hypothetical protein
MKRIRLASIVCAVALSALGIASGVAMAQQKVPKDSSASMAKPPAAASGVDHADNPDNPDNMPVKRPQKATNDKMTREPPASAAIAK